MNERDALETLPDVTAWRGPFDPALQARALDALEAGRVLVLPNLPFVVGPTETDLLAPGSQGDSRKNISLDPASGRVANSALCAADAGRLASMMRRFADDAHSLLRALLPRYAEGLERARTSFRPAEIAGRSYSKRHDDRLLHVDAFPARPMHGRRILRLFSNVAPDGASRDWRVGEPFPAYAGRFLPRVRPALPGSAWLQHRLGLTRSERSPYDHLMLGLHDIGKLDATWQRNCDKLAIRFAAGCTWLCFTDQVLHAALAGHCALEQTFHLPVEAMAHPDRSPLRVLERLTARTLA